MSRYRWNILGLCQVRSWKTFGETSVQEGHKLYFSDKALEGKHEQGVGFLVPKDMINTVMGCGPVSSRLITIRLRASPFNVTIQAYAPTSDYNDDAVHEDFYDHLQEILDLSPKKDILVVLDDWNAKEGEDALWSRAGKALVEATATQRQTRKV